MAAPFKNPVASLRHPFAEPTCGSTTPRTAEAPGQPFVYVGSRPLSQPLPTYLSPDDPLILSVRHGDYGERLQQPYVSAGVHWLAMILGGAAIWAVIIAVVVGAL